MSAGIRRIGELTERHTPTDVATRINRLQRSPFADVVALEVELLEGLNKIGTGMGMPIRQFLCPAPPTTGVSIANAQAENPHPERQLWVRMAGTAGPITTLLFLLPSAG